MSSLDEVFEQMRMFQKSLVEFNDELRLSASSLAKSHEDISALWQDAAAMKYRQVYEPLAQSLDHYVRGDAPRFENFLDNKMRQLDQYLRGA